MLKKLLSKDLSVTIKLSESKKVEKDPQQGYFIFQEEAVGNLRYALNHPNFYKHIIITGDEGLGKRVGIQSLLKREYQKKLSCKKYYYLRTNNTIVFDPDYTEGMIPLFDTDADLSPVIYDPTPSTVSLVGLPFEKKYHAGSLVKGCGGFLILPIHRLFEDKHLYDILRSCLVTEKIDFMKLPELNFFQKMDRTFPHIPIDVRVILIGTEDSYNYLYSIDNDLHEVFPIRIDLESEAEINKKNISKFFTLVDTFSRDSYPKANPSAKLRLLEEALRANESKNRFSLKLSLSKSILEEAMVLFSEKKEVNSKDIEFSIQNIEKRNSIFKRRYFDSLKSGDYLLSFTGARIGRVNALSILTNPNLDLEYGQVNLVSARAMVGGGNFLNIDREVNLSGDIHDKGVLILQSFVKSAFSHLGSFSIDASIVFEQNYSMIDGDSASMAMLIALLSALSHTAIPANIAIMGSVSQHGDALPVGGINLKIRGFYEVTSLLGKSKEGYIAFLPESNVKNIVLPNEIVKAVSAGKFKIFSFSHIQDLIPKIFATPLGKLEKDGKYTKNSIFRKIEEQLKRKKDPE
jgi:predicted ATP-dependent protease